MFKKIFILSALQLMVMAAFAQTSQIEKSLKDPKRSEKEAKADLYIQKNQLISDQVPASTTTPTLIQKRKKQDCKRKS